MTSTDELRMLERDIDDMRELIKLHRQLLAEQLAPHGASPDLIDELLTYCDEWGGDHVVAQLADTPNQLNLTDLPPARLDTVAKLLTQLTSNSIDFDRLVVARESILQEADPTRSRVYPWFGREFTLDATRKTIRFIDSADDDALSVTPVANRVAPTIQAGAAPSVQRTRRPDRDR